VPGFGVSTPLPPLVRAQVVAFAADTLADLPDVEVPSSLAKVRQFIPARRSKLGATPLAAAIEADQVFRGRVAERLRLTLPDLVASIETDGPPAAAPPEEVAAVAYILRLPGWERLVGAAAHEAGEAAASERVAEAAATARRLAEQLEATQRDARAEADVLRGRLAATQLELDGVRRQVRAAGDRVRRATTAAAETVREAETSRDAALAVAREAETEAKRLRTRLAELEASLATSRRGAREARAVDDARLRVLLDTLAAAAHGVRAELDLPVGTGRPADIAAGGTRVDPFAAVGGRGLRDDAPGLIDEVLAVPGVHLIIDGYNVTKRGYGTLTLQAQRVRLLAGIGALAGRAPSSEITVVFDAQAVTARPVGVLAPRGVRVVFSQPDQLADEEIGRLVRAEPAGRPVAVVTSDREVADAARAAGARPVPSAALLARLERA
jgi:predicted RNA-binding protein with PIN domain